MKLNVVEDSSEMELIQTIQGYSGYQTTKNRGQSDKRLREYLVEKFTQLQLNFQNISDHVASQGQYDVVEIINRLIRQLKVLSITFNSPSYNNSSFFNHSNISSNILSKLYKYESQIKHYLFILTDEINEFKKIDEVSEAHEFLRYLFNVIDDLNQIIVEREFLLVDTNDVM